MEEDRTGRAEKVAEAFGGRPLHRSGKTTPAKRFSKEKGYHLIGTDDIVSGLEACPELKIRRDGAPSDTAAGLAPFLIRCLTELSEGNTFYDGIKSVIEGTHIDF